LDDAFHTNFFAGLATAFAPGQYAMPVHASLILLGMTVAFIVAVLLWKKHAPLTITLALFAIMPLHSIMSHWFDNEQRGHLFGYWFGHDMFTPPFEDKTGKFSYDPKAREEMMKDSVKGKLVYPEMTRDAILYGGTDPGRFCPTYMIFDESFIPPRCKAETDPNFDRRDVYIITQNALADGTYLNYIRAHYNRSEQLKYDSPFFQELLRGPAERDPLNNYKTNIIAKVAGTLLDKPLTALGASIEARRRRDGVYPRKEMYIATPDDSQRCFKEYLDDAQIRLQRGQLKPGEDVKVVDNRVQVSGQVAVMAINGLLTKVMFDKNPTNEFFVEESFPLDWMYPHLTPFGVIMKINRQPLPSLPEDVYERDHAFWSKYSERLIGNWITYDTPVSNIVDFADKVYVRRDFSGYKGDLKFARDDQAQKAFSKLRSSIGGVYAWRIGPYCTPDSRPKSPEEAKRLYKEADFTFRQAFAFCPYSPEAVFRYINLLIQPPPGTGIEPRLDDALMIAKTCQKLDPNNGQVAELIGRLEGFKKNSGQMEKARAALQEMEDTVRKNPTNFEAALQLAGVYMQMQQPDQANMVMDRILNAAESRPDVLLTLARYYATLQNWPRLEVALEKWAKVNPDSPEAWFELARFKATFRKPTEAIAAVSNAITLGNKRRAANPKDRDFVAEARADTNFMSLRTMPEFQRLIQ
jgi:tetratricopeptide (TPR) repeat protein